MLGVGVLLLGVTGIIVSLPEPQTSSSMITYNKKLSPDEAAKAAHERIEKAKYQNLPKTKYHKKYLQPLSPDEASKAARARLSKAGAEYVKFKDPQCEDERSFLIDLLTDSQLYEFTEYIERDEEDDDGEYTYSAETLKKDSCCCGATVEDPCACMIEGVMDCSAVEPKCPCYAAEENCQDCGTKLCDSCGFCDICEGGDINPCCARRTYGMRKGWGAESFSVEDRSYWDFLSGDDVPRSATLAWANGADNWEELVYALGSELDEVSAELQRVEREKESLLKSAIYLTKTLSKE